MLQAASLFKALSLFHAREEGQSWERDIVVFFSHEVVIELHGIGEEGKGAVL